MNRTTKQTRALGTFWSGRFVSVDEIAVLAVADEYREALVAIYQERHEAFIDLRNRLFPDLFSALCEQESCFAKIHELEKKIKRLHSEARDRNLVTDEQRDELELLRKQRAGAAARVKEGTKQWHALHRDVKEFWKPQADWVNVKSLAARKKLYDKIQWPEEIADYGRLWMAMDMRVRELDQTFSERLHPATRGEIKDASQPKLGKDKPGIRYQYGRQPECQPWTKMTVQFSGGLKVADALSGKNRQLSLERLHDFREGASYKVRQQVGTAAEPRVVTYQANLHIELPEEAVIQRWSTVVRDSKTKKPYRFAIPILTNCDFTKPTGKGSFAYRLCWTVRKSGVQVAEFWGEHVNERLLLPNWLVEKRLSLKEEQQRCDLLANQMLSSLGALPPPKSKQGIDALEAYCAKHPEAAGAGNLLANCKDDLDLALRRSQAALRCIEKIYETVARRVCGLHDAVCEPAIDLAKAKRYDTRDLLQDDVLPAKSREIMFAVAPGKLRALIKGYGLASVEVVERPPDGARGTDLFSSYVENLGVKTGTKENKIGYRSQSAAEVVMR